jgi:hypothetical protein
MDILNYKISYENLIVMLSAVALMLIIYRLVIFKENFEVDICDYNSPDPTEFCQSIQKGCSELIYENKNLNQNIKENCTTLPTETKDVINTAIVCNDTTNKLIMNNYVQKEICSQIKNYPENPPETEILTPSTNLMQQTSLVYEEKQPPPTYKPLDNLSHLNKNLDSVYFPRGNLEYSPF